MKKLQTTTGKVIYEYADDLSLGQALTNASKEGVSFQNIVLMDETIEGAIIQADFSGAALQRAKFKNCHLKGLIIDIGTKPHGAVFTDCVIDGGNCYTRVSDWRSIDGMRFISCVFLDFRIQGVRFGGLHFEDVIFKDGALECEFIDSKFSGCSMPGTVISSLFKRCDLDRVNFYKTEFSDIATGRPGKYHRTVFDRVNLIGCNFEGATTDYAEPPHIELRGVTAENCRGYEEIEDLSNKF